MEAFWLLSDKDKESVESVDIINLPECLRQFLSRLGQIIYKYSQLGRGTASEDDIKKTVQQRTTRLLRIVDNQLMTNDNSRRAAWNSPQNLFNNVKKKYFSHLSILF